MTSLMDRPVIPEDQPITNGRPGRVRMVQQDDKKFTQIRERLLPAWREGAVYDESLKSRKPAQTALERDAWCQSISSNVSACSNTSCGKVQAPGDVLRKICHQRFHPNCMGAVCSKPLWKRQSVIEENITHVRILQVKLGSICVSNSDCTLRERQQNVNQTIDFLYGATKALAEMDDAPYFVKNSFTSPRADLNRDWFSVEVLYFGVLEPDENLDDVLDFIGQRFSALREEAIIDRAWGDVEIEQVDFKVTDDSVIDTRNAIRQWGKMLSVQAYYDDADGFLTLLQAFKGKRLVQPRGCFYAYPKTIKKRDDVNAVPSSERGTTLTSSLSDGIETIPLAEGGMEGQSPDSFVPSAPPDCAFCGGRTRWIGPTQGPWVKTKGLYSGLEVWLHVEVRH